jgi:integrase
MPTSTLPTYSLQVREQRSGPVYTVMFRWPTGRQVKRTIGPAWTKRGRAPEGHFDAARAHDRAREIVREHVAATDSPLTFRELSGDYLRWLEHVRGAKPSTLQDHRFTLAEPRDGKNGRVMAALGDRPATEVTTREIAALLDALADSGVTPRTVNQRRATLLAIFNYGRKHAGLRGNPVEGTDKRREPQRAPLDTYTATEVEALASAMEDPQDGELVRVAAYTGLRFGELRALRWRDVGNGVLTVSRALSAGVESGTKGGRVRHVPLVPQAAAALDRLRQRGDFSAPDERVFCNWLGRPLEPSALRRRFKHARDATGLRPLRLHDLRHTYGSLLAAAGVPVTDIQQAMGHADIQTTSRYLHARQASEQVDRFARAFAEGVD